MAQGSAKEKRNKPELDSSKTLDKLKRIIKTSSHGLCTLTYQREFSVHLFEVLKVSLGPRRVK